MDIAKGRKGKRMRLTDLPIRGKRMIYRMEGHNNAGRCLVIIAITTAVLLIAGCNNGSQMQASSVEASGSSSAIEDETVESAEHSYADSSVGQSSYSGESGKRSGSSAVSNGASSESSELGVIRNNARVGMIGEVVIREGDMSSFPNYRLWAALEFDEPITFDMGNGSPISSEQIQLGQVATEGQNQDFWEPYVGQRVIIMGTVRGQTWNSWHLTPYYLDDVAVLGFGSGNRTNHRDEVATAFAEAVRTNYHLEGDTYVHGRLDYHPYISPTSELFEWNDGNDDGEEVLILGAPSRVESAEVSEVIGDVYVMNVRICSPVDIDPVTSENQRVERMAIVFNSDDLVEHLYIL